MPVARLVRKLTISAIAAVAAVVLILVLIEVSLRVAGAITGRREAEKMISADPSGRPIVAFCGDSNIYGVYVDASETLPSCVERISRRSGGAGIRSVNLGLPGNASWDVLDQVRRAVAAKPAAIVVTCGINNLAIRPPGEGYGVFENLRIVKTIRRMIFNKKVEKYAPKGKILQLGKEGGDIDGKHVFIEDEHMGAVVVKDREGVVHAQERHALPEADIDYPKICERLRSDLMEMAALAAGANVKLIFSTYFPGNETPFENLTKTMRSAAEAAHCGIADCANFLSVCERGESGRRIVQIPVEEYQNRRSLLLVEDRHPTPIGYEVEARIVARALRRAGALRSAEFDDPMEPLRGVNVEYPALSRDVKDPTIFTIQSQPGDRAVLLFGMEGNCTYDGWTINVDIGAAMDTYKQFDIKEWAAAADAGGKAVIKVTKDFLDDLPRPSYATCMIRRGTGLAGSGRRLLSAAMRVCGDKLAIVNVSVIDTASGTARPGQSIVISNEIIENAGAAPDVTIPDDARVLDGKGKFIIPGLWDMHTHLDDPELLELKPNELEKQQSLPLFVLQGVTAARDMGGSLDLLGLWSGRIQKNELLGPALFFGGPLVDGPKPMWPESVAVSTPEDGRAAVRDLKKRGAEFIKVYSLVPRDAYFAIADEAKKEKIVFCGHTPDAVTNIEASDAGQKSLEHLLGMVRDITDPQSLKAAKAAIDPAMAPSAKRDALIDAMLAHQDPAREAELIKTLLKNHTWICPTLVVWNRRVYYNPNRPELALRLPLIPAYLREWWNPAKNVHLKSRPAESSAQEKKLYERGKQLTLALQEAGVPLMTGSDMGGNPHCFAGFGVHDELECLVDAGLTAAEALAAATRIPAEYMMEDAHLGTIQKGKRADMVLLNSNPLVNIKNTQDIEAVFYRGRYLNKTRLRTETESLRSQCAARVELPEAEKPKK
ncbi:MAG: amidohydrolase family protein [Planctomycetes bacterium]|nr:amidohydrolase family protein [Planctomycetota bacterium]